jgi:hypothetical protein
MERVIQHSVADDCFVQNGDEAITRCDFTPNKVSTLILLTRNVVERAKSLYVSLNG